MKKTNDKDPPSLYNPINAEYVHEDPNGLANSKLANFL